MYCQYVGCDWTEIQDLIETHEATCIYEPSRIPAWIKKGSLQKGEDELDNLQMKDPEHADIMASMRDTIPKGSLRERLYMKNKQVREKMGTIEERMAESKEVNDKISQEKNYLKTLISGLDETKE